MATTTITGCLRQVDGKLAFIDTNCDDLELEACFNASGEIVVYHSDCDGVDGSDGWYTACIDSSGLLAIQIPDDCCGEVVTATYSWTQNNVHSFNTNDGLCDRDDGVPYAESSQLIETSPGTWTLYGFAYFYDSDSNFIQRAFRGTNSSKTGTFTGIDGGGNADTATVASGGIAGPAPVACNCLSPSTCEGDANEDDLINVLDVIVVRNNMCSASAADGADVNDDSVVDVLDWWYVYDRLGNSCP